MKKEHSKVYWFYNHLLSDSFCRLKHHADTLLCILLLPHNIPALYLNQFFLYHIGNILSLFYYRMVTKVIMIMFYVFFKAPVTSPDLRSVLTWDLVLSFFHVQDRLSTLQHIVPDIASPMKCPACPEVLRYYVICFHATYSCYFTINRQICVYFLFEAVHEEIQLFLNPLNTATLYSGGGGIQYGLPLLKHIKSSISKK